ncbi:MAG: hypothetical protein CVU49_00235 [Candidatus Cloacimonetes bacterium HGW-Cloacimonetes-2]|jgi:hypothetical protein|nr:MAG: hypothetical protein CVU49_00235 [Candidatus Cloacimonetes bacterium HGW-Cloacimonetes-2]
MNSIQTGSVVAFYNHGELILGIITAISETYADLIDRDKNTYHLPINRFQLISPALSSDDLYPALLGFIKEISDYQPDPDSIRAALDSDYWTSFSELNERLAPGNGSQAFALYIYLRENPSLFLWKKDQLRLRSPMEQVEYIRMEAKEDAERSFIQRISPALEAILLNKAYATIPEADQITAQLRTYLISGTMNDLIRHINNIDSGDDTEHKIHKLRIALGDISGDTDPVLERSGLPVLFPTSLSRDLIKPLPTTESYTAFSIDEGDGNDFDDAISFNKTDTGYSLGIHISAVAARIAQDSELFAHTQERISSIYLAPGTTPLLPEELSGGELSLIKDSKRLCLSLILDLDNKLSILNSRFALTEVFIENNYSYRDVDRLIHQEPYQTLQRLARLTANARGKQDDASYNPIVHYIKKSGDQLRFRRIDFSSPARQLIEELMVLYNSHFARYAMNNGLALIFRNVSPIPEGDAPQNSQAFLSTTADYHPGTGSQAYVHASSPIRRFTDLVNQYQMLSSILGYQAPFSAKDLDDLIPMIETRLIMLRSVIQASDRYWLLQLLKQSYLETPLSAFIIKPVRGGFVVELIDWQKRLLLHTDSDNRVGSEIQIVLHSVMPDKGYAAGDIIS